MARSGLLAGRGISILDAIVIQARFTSGGWPPPSPDGSTPRRRLRRSTATVVAEGDTAPCRPAVAGHPRGDAVVVQLSPWAMIEVRHPRYTAGVVPRSTSSTSSSASGAAGNRWPKSRTLIRHRRSCCCAPGPRPRSARRGHTGRHTRTTGRSPATVTWCRRRSRSRSHVVLGAPVEVRDVREQPAEANRLRAVPLGRHLVPVVQRQRVPVDTRVPWRRLHPARRLLGRSA